MSQLSDVERARIAEAARSRKMAPGGVILPEFDPLPMAAALESEAERALMLGFATGTPGKVDISMDPRDAIALAQLLRKTRL